MTSRRLLYLQYTNPAGYPPLEHSSRILSQRGWKVLFLGVQIKGVESLAFPEGEGVKVRLLPRVPKGFWIRVHYLAFMMWALLRGFWFRPLWIYASDPWSCPAALLLKRWLGARLLYHEHDCPNANNGVSAARAVVAKEADAIVLPQTERAALFVKALSPKATPLVVYNCPRLSEIPASETPREPSRLRILFQGSLVPARLPLSLLTALVGLPAELWLLGYAPNGAEDFPEKLKKEAERLGVGDQVRFLGAKSRHEMLKITATADVGLALLPLESQDINQRHMVGASNKAFDHLAFGAPLLVSDTADWREWFVKPRYALACNPEKPETLAAALQWFTENPEGRAEMGRLGKARCLKDWNYEFQFAPVVKILES